MSGQQLLCVPILPIILFFYFIFCLLMQTPHQHHTDSVSDEVCMQSSILCTHNHTVHAPTSHITTTSRTAPLLLPPLARPRTATERDPPGVHCLGSTEGSFSAQTRTRTQLRWGTILPSRLANLADCKWPRGRCVFRFFFSCEVNVMLIICIIAAGAGCSSVGAMNLFRTTSDDMPLMH